MHVVLLILYLFVVHIVQEKNDCKKPFFKIIMYRFLDDEYPTF